MLRMKRVPLRPLGGDDAPDPVSPYAIHLLKTRGLQKGQVFGHRRVVVMRGSVIEQALHFIFRAMARLATELQPTRPVQFVYGLTCAPQLIGKPKRPARSSR